MVQEGTSTTEVPQTLRKILRQKLRNQIPTLLTRRAWECNLPSVHHRVLPPTPTPTRTRTRTYGNGSGVAKESRTFEISAHIVALKAQKGREEGWERERLGERDLRKYDAIHLHAVVGVKWRIACDRQRMIHTETNRQTQTDRQKDRWCSGSGFGLGCRV